MKKRNLFKIISMLLICMILFTVAPMSAIASSGPIDQQNISPRWTCIVETITDFSINGTTAIVDCWVQGDINNATKAKVIAELQVKSGSNWIAYGTWTDTQNDFEAAVYETKGVKKGNTYRLKATYTVWEGSQSESTVVFSDEVTA